MPQNTLPVVVIADQEPASQRQLVELLSPSFRCIVVSSLRNASLAVQRERPELLILDPEQPDGDGLALIRTVLEHPLLRRMLVACVTRRATVPDKIAAFRAGADDYIVKPIAPSTRFLGRMLLLCRAGHTARAVR